MADDAVVVDEDLLSAANPGVGAGERSAGDLAALVDLDQDRPIARPRVVAGERIEQRAPVESPAVARPRARLGSGEVEQSRGDIDVRGRQADPARRRGVEIAPRDPDHRRDLDRLLVGEPLRLDDPVLAVEEPVVGVEDEDGVGELVVAPEVGDHVPDPAVGLMDRRGPAAHPPLDGVAGLRVDPRQPRDVGGLVGDAALAGGIRRQVNPRQSPDPLEELRPGQGAAGADAAGEVVAVRRELVELQVERPARGRQIAQQIVRPPVQVAGHVLTWAVAADGHRIAVDREVVVAVVEVDQPDPVIPSRRRRRRTGIPALVAVQEAPDVGGLVAGASQPGGQDVGGVAERLIARAVREDPVVVPVLAGQLGGAGGAAERRRDREVASDGCRHASAGTCAASASG